MADDAASLVAAIATEQGFNLDALEDGKDQFVALAIDTALEHIDRQVRDRLGRKERKHLAKLVEKSDWPGVESLLAGAAPGFYTRAAFHAGIIDSLLMFTRDPAHIRWGRIATFDGPSPLFGCALSPDGMMVAAAGSNGDVTVWDTATGEVHTSLNGHVGEVIACGFSPDGTLLASGGMDRTAKVWEIATGLSTTLVGHEERVIDCVFSPDGSTVATAGMDGLLKLWDTGTGREKRSLRGHEAGVATCAFSPDGRTVLSGGSHPDNKLTLWEVDTGTAIRAFEGHENGVSRCRFGPDGSYAVSSSGDLTVRIWDVATGHVRHTLEGHEAQVYGCDVSWDGSLIISTDHEGVIRFWEAASGTYRNSIPAHLGTVMGCAIGPATPAVSQRSGWSTESGVLATSGIDETVHLWGPAAAITWGH